MLSDTVATALFQPGNGSTWDAELARDWAVGRFTSQINGLHLYHYTGAEVLGIPTWIAWVYFSGAPAVGNLGRRVRADLVAGGPPASPPPSSDGAAPSDRSSDSITTVSPSPPPPPPAAMRPSRSSQTLARLPLQLLLRTFWRELSPAASSVMLLQTAGAADTPTTTTAAHGTGVQKRKDRTDACQSEAEEESQGQWWQPPLPLQLPRGHHVFLHAVRALWAAHETEAELTRMRELLVRHRNNKAGQRLEVEDAGAMTKTVRAEARSECDCYADDGATLRAICEQRPMLTELSKRDLEIELVRLKGDVEKLRRLSDQL